MVSRQRGQELKREILRHAHGWRGCPSTAEWSSQQQAWCFCVQFPSTRQERRARTYGLLGASLAALRVVLSDDSLRAQ